MAKTDVGRGGGGDNRSFIERPATAILFLLSVFVGGLVIGAIVAKLRPPVRATTGPTAVYVVGTTGPAGIAVGERLEVVMADTVTGGTGKRQEVVVDENGNIALPLMAKVNVRGMTPEQAARVIEQGYRDRQVRSETMQIRVRRKGGAATATTTGVGK